MKRIVASIHGTVQGVGFRYAARAEATRLRLGGFARNRVDGSVEVAVEGADDAVDRMLDWLGTGPASAQVTAVETTEVDPIGETDFVIRR